MNFGEKLTNLRKSKNLSQEELAEKLNVSRQTISKWELDQTVPDTENLVNIATFFDTTVGELLDEKSNQANTKEKSGGTDWIKVCIIIVVIFVIVYWIWKIIFAHFIIGQGLKIYNASMDGMNEMVNGFNNFNTDVYANVVSNENTTENYNESYSESHVTSHTETSNVNGVETTSSSYSVTTSGNNGENTYSESYTGNDKNEYENTLFNNTFIHKYPGKLSKHFTIKLIDEIITSNESNPEHTISVSFGGLEAKESDALETIKSALSDTDFYEATFEKGEDGYINKAIIRK